MHALKVDVRIQLVEHKALKFEKSMLDHFHRAQGDLDQQKFKSMEWRATVLAASKEYAIERSKIDGVFGSALNQSERRRNWNDMGDLLRIAMMR